MNHMKKSVLYHNFFIYHNLTDPVSVTVRYDDEDLTAQCIDISLGGIGIVMGEFIPVGTLVEITINLNDIVFDNFPETTTLIAEVVFHHEYESGKLNGMHLQLTKGSFQKLRRVNNHLTNKLSSDDIYAILEESGVEKPL